MLQLKQGILIVVEGTDGSGKSTLLSKLSKLLQVLSLPLVLTKEFGGTPLGQKLRTILHKRDSDICDKAEYLLIAADRAQHSQEVIIPNLKNKKLIISDRMGDSSLVYQGYARNLDKDMIKKINAWAMNNKTPDLTLYVRLDLQTALSRIQSRNKKLTAFEKENEKFFNRVIQGYDDLYKDRNDVIILDGTLSPEALTQDTYKKVTTWLRKQNLL